MKLICYFVIIIWSNITKIVSELTRYLINLDLKNLKIANHCIKYLYAIKFLTIRYSNLKDEELSNQISSSNKEISSTSNLKLKKKTSSNKEDNDKHIFKKQLMHFLQIILIEKMLKNIFSNYLIIWLIELSKNNSSSRFSSSKRNFSRCYTLTKNSFDEYISFRNWSLIRIKK
jgi:hypothetical protein